MRIVLDECLPRQLADELPGHSVVTVQKAGWAGLKNGALLKNISGQYEIFLTIDKRLERQQELPIDVAVITIRARSNRIEDLKPLVPAILRALKDAVPGRSALVGS